MIEIVGLRLQKLEGQRRKGLQLYEVAEDAPVLFHGLHLTTIKKGFPTDRTTWPRFLRDYLAWLPFVARWLADAEGKYTGPAVFHDHALTETDWPKWDCDLLYQGALRSYAVSALTAFIFGGAVRTRRPGKAFRA